MAKTELWPKDAERLLRKRVQKTRERAAKLGDHEELRFQLLDSANDDEYFANILDAAIKAQATHWEETEANEVGVANDGFDCAHQLRQGHGGSDG